MASKALKKTEKMWELCLQNPMVFPAMAILGKTGRFFSPFLGKPMSMVDPLTAKEC